MDRNLNISPSHPAAITIAALEKKGCQAWLVGGWVRDGLLGLKPHDADIACSASWQRNAKILRDEGFPVHETGVKHGTITAIVADEPIEITTFRQDGPYSDARRPDYVRFVNRIVDDLARRDFTINAMAYHPTRGLLDPYGGEQDLREGRIRAVGCAHQRFEEDPLRILRAIRFSSQLAFSIEEDTANAARQCAPLLESVAAERKGAELTKLLLGKGVLKAMEENIEILAQVLPEVTQLRGFALKSSRHSFDLFGHLAHSVDAAPYDEAIRWAALLHDVGKPRAHNNHARLGAREARKIMERLRLPRVTVGQTCDAIAWHETSFVANEQSVRLFVACLGGDTARAKRALELQKSDALGHGPWGKARASEVDKELSMLDELQAGNEPLGVRDLDIRGDEVRDACGVQGKRIAQTLEALLAAVIDGEVPNNHDSLLAFCEKAQGFACEQLFQKRLEKFLTKTR